MGKWKSLIKIMMFRFSGRLRGWIDKLLWAKDELGELASGTENDFLEIGGRLNEYYRRADDIAKKSALIAGMISGQEVESATEKLLEILSRVRILESGSHANSANLRALLDRFDDIRIPLQGFERVVKNLSILCNFIRIENARFGTHDTGFDTVTASVRKLAASIEHKTSQLEDKSAILTTLIGSNLARISNYEMREKNRAGFFLENAVQSVNRIQEKNTSAAESLQDVSKSWGLISKGIGGIVTSVQFHDITRQRIEHARNATFAVSENLSKMEHGLNGFGSAADTCSLQVAQLRHASDEFVGAVEKIVKDLTDIGRNATMIADETHGLAGVAGKHNKSFLAELEGEIYRLIEAVSEYVALNKESLSSLSKITDTVGDMSVFVKEIDGIGIEMKMIALNACVHAAHMGEDGVALGVLASAIQRLSDETSQRINAVEEKLRAIIILTKELSAEADDQDAWKGKRIEALRHLVIPLHDLDREIVSLTSAVVSDGNKLSEDIEETIHGIKVHKKIAAITADVSTVLNDVALELRSYANRNIGPDEGSRLEELASMYTMQREREIHASISPPGSDLTQETALPTNGNEVANDNELGENVELF